MKCLSVKQPWVTLTELGKKPVEVRSWQRDYRGPVILCACARPETRPIARGYECGSLGVTICVADLVDIRKLTEDDFARSCIKADFADYADQYGWHWANIRSLPRVPVSGMLGLWNQSGELLSALGM